MERISLGPLSGADLAQWLAAALGCAADEVERRGEAPARLELHRRPQGVADREADFAALCQQHQAPRPRKPLNLGARALAGFSAQELAHLQESAQ